MGLDEEVYEEGELRLLRVGHCLFVWLVGWWIAFVWETQTFQGTAAIDCKPL